MSWRSLTVKWNEKKKNFTWDSSSYLNVKVKHCEGDKRPLSSFHRVLLHHPLRPCFRYARRLFQHSIDNSAAITRFDRHKTLPTSVLCLHRRTLGERLVSSETKLVKTLSLTRCPLSVGIVPEEGDGERIERLGNGSVHTNTSRNFAIVSSSDRILNSVWWSQNLANTMSRK